MSFETLGLVPSLLSAVQKAGFTAPTSVQEASIPKALAGHDLMVSAQTGSGKTAAFMLPALNRISQMPPNKGSGVQVLVLTPTRELAMQVADATKSYGAHIKDLRVATVVGGMPYGAQLKALSRRVDVLVATPGRLIDHLQAKRVNLSTVHTLVLDEADRMLDMGFIEDIEMIVGRTPDDRQTLLFSATLDGTVARLAANMMSDPLTIEVSGHKQKHTNITQSLLYADDNGHKLRLLDHLLRDSALDQAIVFTATKRGADDLADHLSEQGFSAAALHGDMNQRQRTRTLGLLQNRRLRILVATDVAARGIDVQGISHAINYDLPMQPEDYTHRIGRTGRAGNSGLAFTLATHSERHKIRRIEHFIGQPIPSEVIEGLEPKKTVRPTYTERKGKGGNGKRFGGHDRGGYAGGKPGGFGGKPGGFGGKSHGFGGKPSAHGVKSTDNRERFGDKPAHAGHSRFDDKPFQEGRPARGNFDGRPARQGEGRFEERGNGYAARGDFAGRRAPQAEGRFEDRKSSFKGRTDRRPTEGFADRADRPAFGDRKHAPSRDRAATAARPAFSGKPSGAKPRTSAPRRPSFA